MKLIKAPFSYARYKRSDETTIVADNVTRFHAKGDKTTYVVSGYDCVEVDIPYAEFQRLMSDE